MRCIISILLLFILFTYPTYVWGVGSDRGRARWRNWIENSIGPNPKSSIINDTRARQIFYEIIEEASMSDYCELRYQGTCHSNWNILIDNFNNQLNQSHTYKIIEYKTPMEKNDNIQKVKIGLNYGNIKSFIAVKRQEWINISVGVSGSRWTSEPNIITYSMLDPTPRIQEYGEMNYYYSTFPMKRIYGGGKFSMVYMMHGKLCLDWYSIYSMSFRLDPASVSLTLTILQPHPRYSLKLDDYDERPQMYTYVIRRYVVMPGTCKNINVYGYVVYHSQSPRVILDAMNEDIAMSSINPTLTVDNWTLVLY